MTSSLSIIVIIISSFILLLQIMVVAQQTSRPLDSVVFRAIERITSCTAYNGNPGTCELILNCNEFQNLNVSSDKELVEIMKKSKCGFQGNIVKVCCPDNSNNHTTTKFLSPLTTLENVQCGKTNYTDIRIIGGKNSTLGVWKWMAAIGYNSTDNDIVNFRCGGSLIKDRYVLTAAHCFNNQRYKAHLVRFGELDLNDEVNDGAHPVDVLIQNVIMHQSYLPSKLENDVALIRLQNAVPFNDHIQPICLPTPQIIPDLLEKLKPIVIGWGDSSYNQREPKTTHLQEVEVYVRHKDQCRRNYTVYRDPVIDHRVICAGTRIHDACLGDSGGPLMRPFNYTFYVIGVVSYGVGCGNDGFPGVYTNVSAFIPWIYDNISA